MSDKETKGAYIPFRELLVDTIEYWTLKFGYEKHYLVPMQVEAIAKYRLEAESSLVHYDELLRIAGMEEVK